MGTFPLDPSQDELAFGFGIAESPTGQRALSVALTGGLLAVKVTTDDGATEYIVCNDRFEALYAPAKSLDELRTRFATAR